MAHDPFSETKGNRNVNEQSRSGGRSSRKRLTRRILAIAVVVIGVSGFFTAAYAFHLIGPAPIDCWARPSNVPSGAAYFVVVMGDSGINVGFNGSRYHNGPWPIMNVTLGQTVFIHVINNDTVQSHGFAIQQYFTGFSISPRSCGNVTPFTAFQTGSFLVYCYIFCTIHSFMQNGRLNIS